MRIPCGHCGGHGTVELTGRYRETFDLVRKLKHPATGAQLSRLCRGAKPTAMNNRLAVLEKHGLLKSELYGRERRYSVK